MILCVICESQRHSRTTGQPEHNRSARSLTSSSNSRSDHSYLPGSSPLHFARSCQLRITHTHLKTVMGGDTTINNLPGNMPLETDLSLHSGIQIQHSNNMRGNRNLLVRTPPHPHVLDMRGTASRTSGNTVAFMPPVPAASPVPRGPRWPQLLLERHHSDTLQHRRRKDQRLPRRGTART